MLDLPYLLVKKIPKLVAMQLPETINMFDGHMLLFWRCSSGQAGENQSLKQFLTSGDDAIKSASDALPGTAPDNKLVMGRDCLT